MLTPTHRARPASAMQTSDQRKPGSTRCFEVNNATLTPLKAWQCAIVRHCLGRAWLHASRCLAAAGNHHSTRFGTRAPNQDPSV